MIPRSRRRKLLIDHRGVPRPINPYEGTPTAAVFDSVLTMAGKTNAQFPELNQCYPEEYASFVEQQFAIWIGGFYGMES